MKLNSSLLKTANAFDEAPNDAPNQLNMYNNFPSGDANTFNKKKTSLETESQPKSNLTTVSNNDSQEQSKTLHLAQRHQTQMQQPAQQIQAIPQSQQPQLQNTHVSQNQTLNEQQLQSTPSQMQNQAQIMHSQTPTSYSQHQTYGSYAQHQTLRNSAAHYTTVEPVGINSYNSYPQPQYSDYPSYGSQQQSARYHPVSNVPAHTAVTPVIHPQPSHPPAPTNTQTAAASHPPSLSDFYGSYYPQWSTFMLTAPSPASNENTHLMHSTYSPLAAPSHSHSHHAKVQSNSHPWQQYHP